MSVVTVADDQLVKYRSITMFRIKICGVRCSADIAAVARADGDAIGLNFYPPSIRYVDPADPLTKQISIEARQQGLLRVGVFVNESAESIAEILSDIGLDAVQLHGDETIQDLGVYRRKFDCPIIRAIKLPVGPLTENVISTAVDPWLDAGSLVLLDADAGSQHGGSGKTLDWPVIGRWACDQPDDPSGNPRWTLAGGLDPENISLAIQQTGAKSIDCASGVEHPKGIKSASRIAKFVTQSRV
jgi:phosphoribosylanthranilate isomerase